MTVTRTIPRSIMGARLLLLLLSLLARPTSGAAAAAFGLTDAATLRSLGVPDADVQSLIDEDDIGTDAGDWEDVLSTLSSAFEDGVDVDDEVEEEGAQWKSSDDWWRNPLDQFDDDGNGAEEASTDDDDTDAQRMDFARGEIQDVDDSIAEERKMTASTPIASIPVLFLSNIAKSIFVDSPLLVQLAAAAGFARFGWPYFRSKWDERNANNAAPTAEQILSEQEHDDDQGGLGALFRSVRHRRQKTITELETEVRSLTERSVRSESKRDIFEEECSSLKGQLQDMRQQIQLLSKANTDLRSHLQQINQMSDSMQKLLEGMKSLSASLDGLSSKASGKRFYGSGR